ncbi:MAG: hypothetical protein IJ225_04450 [Solobacterium sp.]|nr:hypothetical protein [Solobacterium sp.]
MKSRIIKIFAAIVLLAGTVFNGKTAVSAEGEPGETDTFKGDGVDLITVSPSTILFDPILEGSSSSEKTFQITNTGASVSIQLSGDRQYFYIRSDEIQGDLFETPFTIGENATITFEVMVNSGISVPDTEEFLELKTPFTILDREGNFLAKFDVTGRVNKNADYHACTISPDSTLNTTKMVVSCAPSSEIISSIGTNDTISFEFYPENGPMMSYTLNPERNNSDSTLVIGSELIQSKGIHLDGDYVVRMMISSKSYEFNNGTRVELHTTSLVNTFEPGVMSNPNGIRIQARGNSDGQVYVDKMYDTQRSAVSGADYSYVILENQDHYYEIYFGENEGNYLVKNGDEVVITPDVLQSNNVTNGTYDLTIHVPGYKDYTEPSITVSAGAVDGGTFTIIQNPNYSITIVPNSGNYDVLKSITGFSGTYEDDNGMLNWQRDLSFGVFDDEHQVLTLPYNPSNPNQLVPLYSILRQGENVFSSFKILANGYGPATVESSSGSSTVVLNNPIREIPEDLKTYILGTKLLICTADKGFLNDISYIRFVHSASTHTDGDFTVDGSTWDFSNIERNNAANRFEMVIPIDYSGLLSLTSKPLDEYLVLPRNFNYQETFGSVTENFKATAFLNDVSEVSETPQVDELIDLDARVENADFKHVDLQGVVTDNANLGITVNGTLAGAVTAEDFDDNRDQETVRISTTVNEIADDELAELNDYASEKNYGEVRSDYGVTINIDKLTANASEPEAVTELGLNSAITFNQIPELEEGEELVVITMHNGEIKELPVTLTDDGKAIVYTKEFSSFVLAVKPVEEPTTPEQNTPTVPKTTSSSEKSSNNKESKIAEDNVITCQMAGYPANYAWNESAKACQAGYLDVNGAFHSYPRLRAVNTYDEGLLSTAASLLGSAVVAIAAGYVLRRHK